MLGTRITARIGGEHKRAGDRQGELHAVPLATDIEREVCPVSAITLRLDLPRHMVRAVAVSHNWAADFKTPESHFWGDPADEQDRTCGSRPEDREPSEHGATVSGPEAQVKPG